ncbi:response regulator transcription factor [Kineosporia sp. A_224]|uniref:response regulator transcription factor n=1 Tax=Kineosporia sp. A_224 TaxID=1962180 RepID=UPI000B4BE595|nr:response regulator transcription factor [Kineosporia sp. A_224]
MPVVLIVEDDPGVREGLELGLTHLGHQVRTAPDGEAGLEAAARHTPHVVVLDVMLPGIDGFEVCRRLRAAGSTPVIMLTARGDDVDVVAGLEAGADDYVTKPVVPRVLDARIKAVLRRAAPQPVARTEAAGLTIDRAALVVTKHGRTVDLTPTELRLLLALSERPGQVLSREQLLGAVWDHDYLGDSRLVDACVQRLRAKIEDVPSAPLLLHTVRGFGYRFGPA